MRAESGVIVRPLADQTRGCPLKSVHSLFVHSLFGQTRLVASVAAALLLAFATESLAAPITVPPGLNPGDPYRLVFVTSTTTNATSSDISDYDLFVTNLAQAVPELVALSTNWRVIGSTNGLDARDHTSTLPSFAGGSLGVPIFLLDGTKLADSYDDLWDGTLDASPRVNESGTAYGDPGQVWVGTFPDGTARPTRYLGDSPDVVFGHAGFANSAWMQDSSGPATQNRRLYAISSIVPEPGTALLLGGGLLGLAIHGRHRKA